MAIDMLFKYSGRNSVSVRVPEEIRICALSDYPEHAPYECRVYDQSGKLKYQLTRDQLMDRRFRRAFNGFVKGSKK